MFDDHVPWWKILWFYKMLLEVVSVITDELINARVGCTEKQTQQCGILYRLDEPYLNGAFLEK